MELSELEHTLDIISTPVAHRLALAHVTVGRHLSNILKCGELRPAHCEVFGTELLYFSYGGPRYRPALQFTEDAGEFPVVIVLRPSAARLMDCFYPFDTGAVHSGLLGEPWSSALKQFDRFRVLREPSRLVCAFYGTNENFMRGKVVKWVPDESPLPILHSFLCQDFSAAGIDQRQRTIECVTSSSVTLCEEILWLAFPDIYAPCMRDLYERCKEGFDFYPYPAETRESPAALVTMLNVRAKERFHYLVQGPGNP